MPVEGEWHISRIGAPKKEIGNANKDTKLDHHDKLSISFSPAHITAFLFFIGLAFFLVIYGWIPSKSSLHRENAKLVNVEKKGTSRYEAMFKTETGLSIACTGKISTRGWANTCPVNKLMNLQESQITVLHDGKRPYEIVSDDEIVLVYRRYRESQLITFFLAVFSLACAVVSILKRESKAES
jgi:hypothetical protein